MRRFEEGDVEAFWRLVHNPPREWRFVWFPGDLEVVGQSLEETVGVEQAALLRRARSIGSPDELPLVRAAIEDFIRAHPGDPTAISAGLSYVLAEDAMEAKHG